MPLRPKKNSLVSIALYVVAILLLLPATVFCSAGMSFAALGIFLSELGEINTFFLAIAVFLLLPGYGLYSLWWLVFMFNSITFKDVPFHIWLGITIGGLVAILFVSPFVLSGFKPPTEFTSWSESFEVMIIFGGGPLLVLITTVLFLWLKSKREVFNY